MRSWLSGWRALALVVAVTVPAAARATPERYAVFQSQDSGRSWLRFDAGLAEAGRIHGLTASPTQYFAAAEAGVYRSDATRREWRLLGRLPPGAGKPMSVLLHGETLLVGTAGGGLLQSPVSATAWQRVDATAGRRTVRALVQSGDDLVAGLDAGGVLRSRDGGRRWAVVSEGLPEHAQVFDLAVMGREVYAALYSKGVYRWRLDEETPRWIRAGDAVALALAVTGSHLAAGHNPGGLLWSADQGNTWVPALGEHPALAPVWSMAGSEEVLVAGVADGVFRSLDRGRTWTRCGGGLAEESPGIAFHTRGTEILAAVILRRWDPE